MDQESSDLTPEEEVTLINACMQQAVALAHAKNQMLGIDEATEIEVARALINRDGIWMPRLSGS